MFRDVMTWLLIGINAIVLLSAGPLLNRSAEAESSAGHFRIGFSGSMLTDINENDAKASLKIWGEFLAKEQNVPSDPDPIIFKNSDAMLRSLREKKVDALGITTLEYDRLRQETKFAPIFVTYHDGQITERYVLLAHKQGRVNGIADLDGASLLLYTNPRACLAPLWLDTVLARQARPTAARFAGKVSGETKLSKVVLPVFFRQTDACVVTRSGFDTMAELNPQIAKQLIVLAESPEMVPAVFAFRADYNPTFKDKLVSGLNALRTTPAGRQVLTIFQSENIEEYPASCLDSALELIAAHKRLLPRGKLP